MQEKKFGAKEIVEIEIIVSGNMAFYPLKLSPLPPVTNDPVSYIWFNKN